MRVDNQPLARLFSLPEELLIHILAMNHPVALVSCRAVCTILLKLIDETTVLKYQIELYADGMVDGGRRCKLSAADRLSQLRCRRQAWKEIKWEHHLFPLIPGSWNAYELVDGIFSKTLNSIEENAARGILFASLPSRHNPGSLTLFEDLGITFRDFAMDPTQDLIVYMQCNRVDSRTSSGDVTRVTLHFRTISDNKMHPHAREPSVSVTFQTDVLGAVIQTVNDIVGFMSWDNSRSQLHIWDWRRGTRLVSEMNFPALDDFAFLSDRAYVLTSSTPEACFRVYTFDMNPDSHDSGVPPTLRATLCLPPLQKGARAVLMGIHTGPFTNTAIHPLRPPKPFVTAPHARIHVVNIDLTSPSSAPDPVFSCLIVIRNKTFLSYLHAPEPLHVAWDEWGPDETRWIPGGTGSLWLRYVHGERLVRLKAMTEASPGHLEVYDFGAPRGPPSWVTPEESFTMRQAHELFLDTVFASSVVFRLPCRVVLKQECFPYSGFMVDEDRLIGLRRHWAESATSVDVFTF